MPPKSVVRLRKINRQLRVLYSRLFPGQILAPSFLIIGAAKAGTTSLYSYLCEHPAVLPATRKEIGYFSYGYRRGWGYYLSFFPIWPREPGIITGEASPNYMLHPLSASRAHHDLPNARIIAILRNPVDRAFSQFQQTRALGREPISSFEEAIDQEPKRVAPELERLKHEHNLKSFNVEQFSYLTRGMYFDQLQRWADLFPRTQILILCAEEFYADTPAIMHSVQDFLGIPHFDLAKYIPQDLKSEGRNYSPMSTQTRLRLVEYFKSHNEALYQFAGRSFPWDK
jgi:sulfotransferase family protein